MRILIYTGKGGVGKTSIAAATAVRLATTGKKVIVMSTDLAHSLGDSLDVSLGAEPKAVTENLWAMEIDPTVESKKAWGNLRDYLKEIISQKANGGIAADEVLMFPGLDELFSLVRILDIYEEGFYDVIIVDCAPTGETLSLLRYPEQLKSLSDKLLPSVRSMNSALGGLISRKTKVPKPRDIVFEEFDKIVGRLNELQKILKNRDMTSLRIVTTPERIVLDEARRSYTWINEFDFGVDAVCINKIYPDEAMQGYFAGWAQMQQESLALASQSFGESKMFYLKLQEEEIRGIEALKAAGDLLYGETDPQVVFCKEPAFTIEDAGGVRYLVIRLPFVQAGEIRVIKDGDNLMLVVRNQTRRFRLPDKLNRRKLSDWIYEDGKLKIAFKF